MLGYADTEYVAFRENVALFLEQRGSGHGTGKDAEKSGESDWPSGTSNASTPVPGTPSIGRVGMGLGGYVEG